MLGEAIRSHWWVCRTKLVTLCFVWSKTYVVLVQHCFGEVNWIVCSVCSKQLALQGFSLVLMCCSDGCWISVQQSVDINHSLQVHSTEFLKVECGHVCLQVDSFTQFTSVHISTTVQFSSVQFSSVHISTHQYSSQLCFLVLKATGHWQCLAHPLYGCITFTWVIQFFVFRMV